MKTFTSVIVIVLLAGALSTPVTQKDDEKITITEEFFPDVLLVHTAKHDIKRILVPTNSLNFDETKDDNIETVFANLRVFFVEVDRKENGEEVDQGLYVMKGDKVKKLLDHGRDVAASGDNSKSVFFAAKDGLYTYNSRDNTAEKYGTLTDNIIGIEKENGTDVIYILTKENEVYKVTDEGKVKTKVSGIHYAQQIVLDVANNLYFLNEDKNVFIVTLDGVKKFECLPEHPAYVALIRPPFILDDGIPIVIDNKSYIIYPNGTCETEDFVLQVKPTAYSMEAAVIQYYAYDKKIYKYDMIELVVGTILEVLKEFLEENKSELEAISTRLQNRV